MTQHFLLSAAARSLSIGRIARLTDDEAHECFRRIRFADNGGEAFCPRCGCTAVYAYQARRVWKCKACNHQFSVTSGTIFAGRKLPIKDYLSAIALFVNAAKGMSALQLGRDMSVQYKTAFVLAHKLRTAIGTVTDGSKLVGEVEIDGAYFGGHTKQANRKADRKSRRHLQEQDARRQVVVVARERRGRTLTFVVRREALGAPFVRQHVVAGSVVHADEAAHWDALHGAFQMRRINHSVAFSAGGACTNLAESFFSRMRRAELGQHHRIAGPYLLSYAREMAWREDHRRRPNGALHEAVTAAALAHGRSETWTGYWQRAKRRE